MMWDARLENEIAASPAGRALVGLYVRVPFTLASQLGMLRLKRDDIHYVGLSHLHADHSGNTEMLA